MAKGHLNQRRQCGFGTYDIWKSFWFGAKRFFSAKRFFLAKLFLQNLFFLQNFFFYVLPDLFFFWPKLVFVSQNFDELHLKKNNFGVDIENIWCRLAMPIHSLALPDSIQAYSGIDSLKKTDKQTNKQTDKHTHTCSIIL